MNKAFRIGRFALGFSAVVAVLAGCNGGSQAAPPVSMPQNAARSHPIHPNCCSFANALYVSDKGGNSVYEFDYRTGASLGQIAAPPENWNQPQGECVDANQDVFIANTGMSTVDEYSRSGSFVASIVDPALSPFSCAVDPLSGDLAVGNQGGTITVFPPPFTTSTTVSPPGFTAVYFMSYYAGGALFFDGIAGGVFQLTKMAPLNVFANITLSGTPCPCTINSPGGVQFVNNANPAYIAVGDQAPLLLPPPVRNIYHVRPNGNVIGITTLSPAPTDAMQFYIKGARVTVPDFVAANVIKHHYPSGTNAVLTFSAPYVSPVAAVVSHQ